MDVRYSRRFWFLLSPNKRNSPAGARPGRVGVNRRVKSASPPGAETLPRGTQPHQNKAEQSPAGGDPAQRRNAPYIWMNCICVPASSIRSPFFSGAMSVASGMPLMLGRDRPSTWAMT
jgi:hypothetical protein